MDPDAAERPVRQNELTSTESIRKICIINHYSDTPEASFYSGVSEYAPS